MEPLDRTQTFHTVTLNTSEVIQIVCDAQTGKPHTVLFPHRDRPKERWSVDTVRGMNAELDRILENNNED